VTKKKPGSPDSPEVWSEDGSATSTNLTANRVEESFSLLLKHMSPVVFEKR
jgi:hypothetical protein